MAPRGTPKSATQVHRVISKCNTTTKSKIIPNTLQRAMMTRRSLNVKDQAAKVDQSTQPKEESNERQPLTPVKQNKPLAQPESVTKSGKKPTWSRRPKPAHSGVPVPEKMRKIFEKLAKEGKQL